MDWVKLLPLSSFRQFFSFLQELEKKSRDGLHSVWFVSLRSLHWAEPLAGRPAYNPPIHLAKQTKLHFTLSAANCPSILFFSSSRSFSKSENGKKKRNWMGGRLCLSGFHFISSTQTNLTTCFLHKNQINLVFMLSASCSINLLL